MVQRGRSIPASSVIDLDWPHQVVLPDDICTDCDFTVITKFCEDRGMRFQIRHFQAVWQNGKYENYPSTASPTARRLRRFATISLERSSFLNATGRMAKYVASDVAPMSTGASSIAARSVSQRSYAPGAKHVQSLQSYHQPRSRPPMDERPTAARRPLCMPSQTDSSPCTRATR